MEIIEFIERMQAFDADLTPQGLYACNKQTLWAKGFFPIIKSKGHKIEFSDPGKTLCWGNKIQTDGILNFLSFS